MHSVCINEATGLDARGQRTLLPTPAHGHAYVQSQHGIESELVFREIRGSPLRMLQRLHSPVPTARRTPRQSTVQSQGAVSGVSAAPAKCLHLDNCVEQATRPPHNALEPSGGSRARNESKICTEDSQRLTGHMRHFGSLRCTSS